VPTLGNDWFYISQNATSNDEWTVSISSRLVSFNIYLSFSESSNPSQFNHDIAFKGVSAGKNFVLSKGVVPDGAFTAAV